MSKTFKRSLLGAGAIIAGLSSAHAQEGAGGSSDGITQLDNIVVTSQRREQSLQDVPISVKAFTNDDISRFDITEFEDYAILTPNLGFAPLNSQGQGAVTVRGIGPVGGEQTVFGTYLDGYELPNVANRVYDLERLEVLRGPQGTTFGRNVIAGALNLTSVTPGFDGVSGYATADVGNLGLIDLEGGVTLPITDNTAIRVAGFYHETDGWLENQFAGGTEGNWVETFGSRLTVSSEPTDRLKLKALVSYESYNQGLGNATLTDGVLLDQTEAIRQFIDFGVNLAFEPGTLPNGPDTYFPNQTTQVNIDAPSFTDFTTVVALGRFDYDLGPATLVGIFGGTSIDLSDSEDLDYSELDVGVWTRDRSTGFYSGELRLESNENEKLNWVVGAYYSRDEEELLENQTTGSDIEPLTLFAGAPFAILPNDTFVFGGFSVDEVDTYAVYGEAEYAVTDRLNLLAGIRYTELDFFESLADGGTIAPRFPDTDIPTLQPFLVPVALDFDSGTVESEKVTWRAGAIFEATNDINVYATVSTGFRGGGLQLNNVERSNFDPDSVINYEIGTKAYFFNRRAAVNLSAFFMDWDDIQIEVRNRATNNRFTDNAGAAEIYGFELDFQVLATEALSFSGGVGYANSEFTEFPEADDPRLNTPLPWSPEWRVNFVADYQRPLFGDVDGFIRAIYIYNDEVQAGIIEDGIPEIRVLDDWTRIDLRAGLESAENWSVEAYIENLTDDVYATGGWYSGFSSSGRNTVAPPQRYGVRVRKEF